MTFFRTIARIIFSLVLWGAGQQLHAFELLTQSTADLPEIVLSEAASPSSQLAARELSLYLEKATGVKLKITTHVNPARNQIILGLLSDFNSLPEKIPARFQKSRNAQGFYHLLQGKTLYIIGQKDPGQLYGVYTFLEDQIGIRWLKIPTEGDDGEYIPQKPQQIPISSLDHYSEPDFIYRAFFQTGSYMSHYPQTSVEWCARVRLQGTGKVCEHNSERIPPFMRHHSGGHGLYDIALSGNLHWPNMALKKQIFEKNPEMFAMQGGKRVLSPEGMGKYCISNPMLQELVVQEGLLFFKTWGVENATFQLDMGDYGSGWCECSECLKQNQTEKYQNDISTLFHNSMASISKKIYAEYPDATISVWSYASHHEVPLSEYNPDPRLLIEYCTHPRCYGHFLDDPNCARNVATMNRIKRWQDTGLRLIMREYDTCTPIQYCPLEEQTAHDLKLYRKMGFLGYSTEAPFPDSVPVAKDPVQIKNRKRFMPSTWQWMYLISRLTWDTSLDPNAILAEIEEKYYGKAYPIMKQYHEFRRILWKNAPLCVGWPYVNPRAALLLNQPGSKEKLLAWLDEASAIAVDNPLLTLRIARDREYLSDFWIKPNEKLKERYSSTFYIPIIDRPVKMDGKGSDPLWLRACYSTEFFTTTNPQPVKIPDELATSVGMLADQDHLYLLFHAQEPEMGKLLATKTETDSDLWADDSCEIFLYPMNTDEKYYQVIVNTQGVTFDSKNLPIDKKFNFKGLKAMSTLEEKAYRIEVAIPTKELGPIQDGTTWKIHFARNRRGPENAGYTIDGEDYHVSSNYRTAVFGAPLLKNITFDEVSENAINDWSSDLNGKPTAFPVKVPSGYAAHIVNGRLYQSLALKAQLYEQPLALNFRARGQGKLEVLFYRYADLPLEKPQNGQYTRRGFVKTDRHKAFELTHEDQFCTFTYTIPANEYVSIAFHAQDATVDDLSINRHPVQP
ncbi:MAG: DUF4838 domain-containing protein [Lentisphaeria bacterium]